MQAQPAIDANIHGRSTSADRFTDIDRALRLEWLTFGWMIIEAVVALSAGVFAHSLILEAFGADSVIELLSAAVLVWRLRVELKTETSFPEAIEHRASRLAGGLLFALTAYVAIGALYGLWAREGQHFSLAGVLVTGAAVPMMYFLAKNKMRVAERIGSRALRADAVESLTCGYLSVAVLLALLAQLAVGAWWVSAVSALLLVPFLLREARAAWAGDHCCHE